MKKKTKAIVFSLQRQVCVLQTEMVRLKVTLADYSSCSTVEALVRLVLVAAVTVAAWFGCHLTEVWWSSP